MTPPRLGVALTGHWLPLEAIGRLVRRADELGYAVIIVDGDATMIPARPDAPIYDATVLATLALAESRRARIAQIQLPVFWNPLALARKLATLQASGGGRVVGLLGVGAGRYENRLGLPRSSTGERIERLEETLEALTALLRGEEVCRTGRFVALERARIQLPETSIPLAIAAAGRRTLCLVERYAQIWDANVPPLREHFAPRRAVLPHGIESWIWIFARLGSALEAAAKDYRRLCPWFSELPDRSLADALLWGEAERCRDGLVRVREELGVDVPILDLAGLDETEALRTLEALAPADSPEIL